MSYLRRALFPVLVLVIASPALGQSSIDPNFFRDGPAIRHTFAKIVSTASESTVRVLADGREVCLGVVVDGDGYILTKWSEIDAKRDKVSVRLKNGKVLKAKVVGVRDDDKTDDAWDLAMLKIEAKGLKAVKWGSSSPATVGRWVASAGVGADPVAVGVVSVATRKYAPGDQPIRFNSGYLGVALEAAPDGDGAKVAQVNAKSPAAKAGIKVDDIIYEAGGRKIPDQEILIAIIGRLQPGDKIDLKIKRGDEDLEITATLEARPKALKGNPQETMGTKLSARRGGFPFILQHDSGVAPQDCGGPLVDLDGDVVGINISRAGRTETFALPAEKITPLLAELKSGKLAPTETARVDPPKKEPVLRLLKTVSLDKDDAFDKKRPNMVPKRYMKAEELKLTAGVTYVIEMRSIALDPYLILEDPDGKMVASDDDSGGGNDAKIVYQAKVTGVHRIICTTFNPGETGEYSISVRRQEEKEKDKK